MPCWPTRSAARRAPPADRPSSMPRSPSRPRVRPGATRSPAPAEPAAPARIPGPERPSASEHGARVDGRRLVHVKAHRSADPDTGAERDVAVDLQALGVAERWRPVREPALKVVDQLVVALVQLDVREAVGAAEGR